MLTTDDRNRPQMPPRKGFVRKIVTVPPKMAEAVREFRFARRLENEVEAYRLLIKLGLEAAEREREQREAEGGARR